MRSYFTVNDNKIVRSQESDALIHVISTPTDQEKMDIINRLGIDDYDFDAALDPEEISRVEFEKDYTAVIWKQPYRETYSTKALFDVFSIGFFIQGETLIIISRDGDTPFDKKIFEGVNSIHDVLLRYLFYTIRQYADHLKAIKQTKSKIEGKLSKSMENRYFLQMFDISESLIYYIDALEANGAVLSKLLTKANRPNDEKFTLDTEQIDYLEDTIQENTQITKQAEIYSTVLSGLMDARGNIINNNVNVLLKNLTLINVVFLPLNLIASMGGMSEYTVAIGEYHLSWQVGYLLFAIFMVVVGWTLWVGLKHYVGRPVNDES